MIFLQVGGVVGEAAGNIIGNILTGIWGVILALVIGGAILGTFWYVRWLKKFNIQVEIQSSRSGGVVPKELEDQMSGDEYVSYVEKALKTGAYRLIFDKAALMRDKKDRTLYFRIKDEKVDLSVPNFDVLQPSNKGMVLKIWQKSALEYFFLLPGKINKEFIIRSDGKKTPIAEVEQYQLEGDDISWMIDRMKRNQNWLSPEHWAMKLLQYLPSIINMVLALFIVWIVLDKIPILVTKLTELASAVTEAQRGTITQLTLGWMKTLLRF